MAKKIESAKPGIGREIMIIVAMRIFDNSPYELLSRDQFLLGPSAVVHCRLKISGGAWNERRRGRL